MKPMILALALLGLALFGMLPAQAATLRARPETLVSTLQAAKPGDKVVLDQNRLYGHVVVPKADHLEPVEIDATGAKLASLTFRNTAGWRWRGGTVDSPPERFRNIDIDGSRRVEISGVILPRGRTGAAVLRGSSDIALRGFVIRNMTGDGIDIADSSRVTVAGMDMADFVTAPGHHPDGIQVWGESADIALVGNRIRGKTQGITTFGPGVVQRLRIAFNRVEVAHWWGISAQEEADADVRWNVVRALDPKMKTRLWTAGTATTCGNEVEGEKPDALC